MVWRGWSASGGFARDDRHFVFVAGNLADLPHVIDLMTGAEVVATSTQIPPIAPVSIGIDAVLNGWAVFRAQWNTYGLLLWTLDWQGRVSRFGPDMPMYVDDYLQGFDPAGTKAIWSRQTNGGGGQPATYLGAFEFDLATSTSTSWTGSDFSCFGRPGQIAFKIAASEVQSCACGGSTCTTIATLPAPPEVGWIPYLLVSSDRRTVVVITTGSLSRIPNSYPEVLCLRAGGEVIARVPWGLVTLDDTGQLLLIRPWAGARRRPDRDRESRRGDPHLAPSRAERHDHLRVIATSAGDPNCVSSA